MGHQPFPVAVECALKSQDGGHEDVDFARLDFLNGADVQIYDLGETLLSHSLPRALAADVRAERL